MELDIEDILRELAKNNKYQTLFTLFKESGVSMFRNSSDYTNYQIYFLNMLGAYYGIYTDIAMDEVDELVLDNPIYEEAYLYYKRNKKEKQTTPMLNTDRGNIKTKNKDVKSFSWNFRKK
jgi:hypothetical protein